MLEGTKYQCTLSIKIQNLKIIFGQVVNNYKNARICQAQVTTGEVIKQKVFPNKSVAVKCTHTVQ